MSIPTYQILLVEDNDREAMRYQTLLKYANYSDFTVTRAKSVGTALTAARYRPYDAVLLDLGLPDAIGIEAVVAITREAADLPIVVLTGHDDFHDGVRAIQAGAQEFLLKSAVDSSILERAIHHSIERRKSTIRAREFFSATLKSVLPAEDVDVAELQQTNTRLIKALYALRDQVKAIAPNLVCTIDDVIRDAGVRESRDSTDVPMYSKLRDVVKSLSVVPEASTNPKDILADILQRNEDTRYSRGQ